MAKYIVAWTSLFDNKMHIKVVNANSVRKAVGEALSEKPEEGMEEFLETLPTTKEDILECFLNSDYILGVEEFND